MDTPTLKMPEHLKEKLEELIIRYSLLEEQVKQQDYETQTEPVRYEAARRRIEDLGEKILNVGGSSSTAIKQFFKEHKKLEQTVTWASGSIAALLMAGILFWPLRSTIHNYLGNYYVKQNRVEEAINEYQTAIKAGPNDVLSAVNHNRLADIYYKQSRLDEAIQECRLSIDICPSPSACNILGNAYHKKGNLDAAIKEFKKAIELYPHSAGVHNNLGNVYYTQGKLEEAIQEMQTALKLDPDSAIIQKNIQKISEKLNQKK